MSRIVDDESDWKFIKKENFKRKEFQYWNFLAINSFEKEYHIKMFSYIWINRRQEVGCYMFRKYVCQQFLIIGLQMFHFLFLLCSLEFP